MTRDRAFGDLPFGDATDEAISALIDGELDAFATDHGLEPDDARGRLEAWSGFAARRAALERTRRAVHDESRLDDMTRRRLVTTATRELTPRRSRWRVPVAAAATIAVVATAAAGIVWLTRGADRRASTSTASKAAEIYAGNLGDVTNPAVLRARLEHPRAGATPTAPRETALAPSNGAATPTGAPAGPGAAQVCSRHLAASGPSAREPVVLLADATYKGSSAVVVVLSSHGHTLAYVLARDTCAILAEQFS